MLEAKAKDQGHKRKCSPKKKKRSSQKFFKRSPKKKRSSQKFFKRSPQKNLFKKNFQALHKILTIQKILLSSSRGQANFRGFEASRPRTSKSVLEAKDVLEDSTSDKCDNDQPSSSTKKNLQVCVFGFKGIAYFDALVIYLEEVAVFSCDMTSLGK